MPTMWMIRGDGGRLYDDFRERNLAAIGWAQLAPLAKPGVSRAALIQAYKEVQPGIKDGTAVSGASQVFRFVNEVKVGDAVVTYSPANRTYLVGHFSGPCQYREDMAEDGMALTRPVHWLGQEVDRDKLSSLSKNSLGSTLTVFNVAEDAQKELLALASGKAVPMVPDDTVIEAEVVDDPLKGVQEIAFERIKDQINSLDWSEMQDLVAGILRAMGYKTLVSPAGADRGKDIIASPDGFGFEPPRIVVEVKHRNARMGSSEIRSFLGGRHKDDRGLYVSTGGFTKDALYEGERANVHLTMWTLDELARTLMAHYPMTDPETKRLVPLTYFYIPA
ncbi:MULTISPECIES: restriction endonuclease [Pseudomonas]|uniref:Restriction endonuclease n=2 Tax=Pseudomonas helleri TaxID=1608996 RepID=A0A6L5HR00_9PSED|nr:MULTISPECIES: restriction endonuclease [Pseudomonas]MQT58654.1 restriction endonuclease [Pseudomonas sp. FSL R10-0399]MQU04915.1 restriction endonuclease [Pseudomonas helleri]